MYRMLKAALTIIFPHRANKVGPRRRPALVGKNMVNIQANPANIRKHVMVLRLPDQDFSIKNMQRGNAGTSTRPERATFKYRFPLNSPAFKVSP